MPYCDQCEKLWDAPWDECDCITLEKCDGCGDFIEENTGGYFHDLFMCASCKADNEAYEADGIFLYDNDLEKENTGREPVLQTIQ